MITDYALEATASFDAISASPIAFNYVLGFEDTGSLLDILTTEDGHQLGSAVLNYAYTINLSDTLQTADLGFTYVLTPYVPLPYYLGERVQFVYNGALCQGTIIELLYGATDRIVIEIDVSTNYRALRNFNYNRVVINQQNNILTRVSPPVWY